MYMKYKIGETCSFERDCYNNNCINGVCTRKKRKYKKKLGESCAKDTSCYSKMCGQDGVCIRKTKKRKIGSSCDVSVDCYNKNCVDGVCTRKKRRYKKKLGVECGQDNQCYSKRCVNNVCTRRHKRKKTSSIQKSVPNVPSTMPKTATRIEEEIMQMEKDQNEPDLKSVDINAIELELENDAKPLSEMIVKKTPTTVINKPPSKTQPTPPSSLNVNKFFVVPSVDELFKVREELEALGLRENDFYYDPCYFLNGLRKMMKHSSFDKYTNKMYLLLPIIYPNDETYRNKKYITNKMTRTSFNKQIRKANLGGNQLDICLETKCYMAAGSFGSIYRSQFNGKNIVIKVPISRSSIEEQIRIHNEVFDENMIQSELYCALRGKTSNMARIPKIEFMARLYVPNSEMKIITGIEKLDGDLYGFMKRIVPTMTPEKVDAVLKDALIQLCKLIEMLQDEYKFHHRDLHGGNIMYKNIGTPSEPVYRWFMIDYGYAYLEKDGIKYHKDEIGLYSKYSQPNFAHDFRILFVYIRHYLNVTPKMMDESLILNFINYVASQLNNEFLRMGVKRLHWHNAYDFFKKELYTDTFTNPRSLRNMLESNEYLRFSQPMRSV